MSRQLSHSATPQPHPQQQQQQHPALKRKAEGGPSSGGGANGDPFRSAKRRPPVPALPSLLSLPESALYASLLKNEQSLDHLLARKHAEIADAVASGRQGAGKVGRTMRLFVSCSTTGVGKEGEGEDRAFVMRLEGRLLDSGNPRHDKLPKRKFTSFVRSVIVELPEDVFSAPSNTIEWIRPPPQSHTPQDGFTLHRPLPHTLASGLPLPSHLPVKIHIHLDSSPQKFKVLPELAQVIGVGQGSRTEIVQAVWAYVKAHGLQDREDRRRIRNEGPLGQFFAPQPFLALSHVPELVSRYLTVPDPITLSIPLRIDVEKHVHPKVFDVGVEVEDPAIVAKAGGGKAGSVLGQFMEEGGREVLALDDEIANLSIAIRNARTKRDFLLSFSSSPAEFIERWIGSQAKDLALAVGLDQEGGVDGTGLGREEIRRSGYFELPWAEEAVVLMEAQRLASLQASAGAADPRGGR